MPLHVFDRQSPPCRKVTIYNPFVIGWCCGDQCPGVIVKASADYVTSNSSDAELEHRPKEKRAKYGNCKYQKDGNVFLRNDRNQKATNIINCDGHPSCSQSITTTQTEKSSQSFGVSESTEVGLFDIIQETISFSYMYSYTKSKSRKGSFTYDIKRGDSGYVIWTPRLPCTTGTFHGSDCHNHGIKHGKSGTACVPATVGNTAGGTPDGTYTFTYID